MLFMTSEFVLGKNMLYNNHLIRYYQEKKIKAITHIPFNAFFPRLYVSWLNWMVGWLVIRSFVNSFIRSFVWCTVVALEF